MELVLLDKQDRIGTLTLNRPEKLNAMNPALLDEFSEAIASVSADEEIKVLMSFGAPGGRFLPAMTWPAAAEQKPSMPTGPSCNA